MIPEKNAADLPPWERTVPIRAIHSEKYETNAHACNDDGNAHRFQEECAGYLIYDYDSKEWKAWVENHWEHADFRLVQSERFVADSIRYELESLETQLDIATCAGVKNQFLLPLKKQVHEMEAHINYSKKMNNMKAMAELSALSSMGIHLSKEGDVSLLACKNGIIDTKTGVFYPNERDAEFKYRYPTHYIDCTYTPGAKPELFLEHLNTIFTDNTTPDLQDHTIQWRLRDSVDCFKRLLGYLLVAGNPEQLFIFLWGTGANGKSTTMDVLREVLGGEVAEAPGKELYVSREDKPATGITRGLSQRVLLFAELSDDESTSLLAPKVSTSMIKNLTGDKKTGNFREIYAGSSLHEIICTPVALTNNLPHFDKDLDDAMFRRLITVPHNHVFAGKERDRNMVEKLLQEKDAIFSLLVDEVRNYREEGLLSLPEHWKSGQAQLIAGDAMFTFIQEQYEKTDGSSRDLRIPMRIIEGRFISWCRAAMIDCSTVMKPGGIDARGYTVPVERLTTGGSRNLHKAFRAMGFTIRMYGGSPYVWSKMKGSNIIPT